MTWTGVDVIVHQLTEVDYRVINAMAANQKDSQSPISYQTGLQEWGDGRVSLC